MPWSRTLVKGSVEMGRFRPQGSLDRALHNQTDEEALPPVADRLAPNATDSMNSPSPLRTSFDTIEGEQSALAHTGSRSPFKREPFPNRQRFSMLRFRHASDPQISKTARDQALTDQTPMPTGKCQ